MKLTLTYVKRTLRTSVAGKEFISLSIKAKEYGDKYLSGFGNKSNENWNAGDVVEVARVEEVVKGDKTYLNFEMPRFGAQKANVETLALSHKLDNIIAQNRSIIDHLSGKNRLDLTSAGTPVPTFDLPADDINPDGIPF